MVEILPWFSLPYLLFHSAISCHVLRECKFIFTSAKAKLNKEGRLICSTSSKTTMNFKAKYKFKVLHDVFEREVSSNQVIWSLVGTTTDSLHDFGKVTSLLQVSGFSLIKLSVVLDNHELITDTN